MEQNENMTSVVIEQEGENKKRSALAVILALAVVVILGIGTTFAFLAYTGNQAANRFTTDRGISCDLLEPAWTDAVSAGYPGVASDGTTKIPEDANATVAKSIIAKDPYVVNTGMKGNESGTGQQGVDEYVGIRLTFQKWVATGEVQGVGQTHTEEGQYVTMTDDEVAALMNVYGFTAKDVTATNVEDIKAGLDLGAGWTQVKKDGAYDKTLAGTSEDGSMYFVYTAGKISSIAVATQDKDEDGTADDGTTGNYDPTVSKAATAYAAGDKTTANLFKNVVHTSGAGIDTDTYKTLLDYLYSGTVDKDGKSTVKADVRDEFKTNGTQDPGWRVLVSCAAIDATTSDVAAMTFTDPAGGTAKTAYAKINEKHVANNLDGSSATITGRNANKGSGYRGSVSVPDTEWDY